MAERLLRLALVAGVAVGSAGCVRGCTSSRPPIHPNPNMDSQPRAEAQESSDFFYDGSAMRKLVPGTVARGELREDDAFFEGKDAAGQPLAHMPVELTPELSARGAERYHIYCEPCHDARGDGKGILAQRANIPTASFHTEKILNAGDGYIFDVITNGTGLMSGYRWPIPPADRWAIIVHVRELERKRQEEGAAP